MPHLTFPDERVLKDRRSVDVDGIDCKVFVYEEEGSSFFGVFEWTQWHVRMEVPVYGHGLHENAGRQLFHERVQRKSDVESAIKQLTHRAKHYIDKRITDKGKVLV